MTKWLTPATGKQLQQFLGFSNFYRWLIHDYHKQGGGSADEAQIPALPLLDFVLTYRPGSKTVEPDSLLRQFSANPTHPEPILPPACIVGAVIWQVEECVWEV